MTKTVHFWQGLVGNTTQFNDYQEEITRLLRGELHGLHLEKLILSGKECIYSIRTNKKGRILFTSFEGNLCLLEVLKKHEYNKSRFLKSGVLREHLKSNTITEEPTPLLFEEAHVVDGIEPVNEEESSSFSLHPLERFQSQFIRLSAEQEMAVNASLPLIAFGPAGSGKTCVAMSMLKDFLKQQDESTLTQPILYISQSRPLVQNMSSMWEKTYGPQNVQFKTYQELLGEIIKQEISDDNNETLFNTWHASYLKQKNVQLKVTDGTQHSSLNLAYWQEFRIRSGYSQQDYLSLGKRQSNLSVEERIIVDETYNAFLAYLKDNKITSSELELINPQDKSKFPLIVVDEAQDFSYAQLQNLFALSQEGHIVYFLGDHQILFDGKSRLPFLRQLFYQQNLKATEIALSVSYRCSELVVDISNELIKLKYAVTGGTADKKEKTRLEVARDIQGLGYLDWQSCQAIKNTSLINDAQNNVNIAVIALPEHQDRARQLFNTPLVFTPEEIKGLEYHTIIAYRLFDTPEAQTASNCLSHQEISQKNTINRAKSGASDERLLPYFNQLLTAVTRAQTRLIFIQDEAREIFFLINSIKNLIINSQKNTIDLKLDTKHTDTIKSSQEDWEQEVTRQEKLGNTRQAQEISERLLKKEKQEKPEPHKNTQKKNHSKQKIKKQKRQINPTTTIQTTPSQDLLNDFNQENLLAVLKSADALKIIQKKVVYKDQEMTYIDVLFKKENCFTTINTFNLNPLITLIFLNRQNKDKTVSGLSLLASHRYGQTAMNSFFQKNNDISKKLNVSTIYTLYKSAASLAWIMNRNKSTKLNRSLSLTKKRVQAITPQALSDVIDKKTGICFLYILSSSEINLKLFKNLLKIDPSFSEKITVEALFQLVKLENENTSTFSCLSKTDMGMALLKKIILVNSNLLSSIPAEELFRINTKENTSLFNWLSDSEKGCGILKTLLNSNDSLAESISTEALISRRTLDNTSAFYWLSAHPSGQKILKKLLNSNDSLASSISAEALLSKLRKDNTFAFYWLSVYPSGQKILKKLLNSNDSLASSISAEALLIKRSEDNASAFGWLTLSKDGLEILKKLLNSNDLLASLISAEALLSKQFQRNTSLFYWLSGSPQGLDILKTLINSNKSVAESISIDELLNQPAGCKASPFYWLSKSNKGCDVLVAILKNNKTIAASIPTKELLNTENKVGPSIFAMCAVSNCGREIILTLLKNNKELWNAITAESLCKKTTPSNTSLLFWLCLTPQTCEVLKILLDGKESLATSISVEEFLRPQFTHNNSPLYGLCSSEAGQNILKILFDKNEDLLKSVTAQSLYNTVSKKNHEHEPEKTSALYWLASFETGIALLLQILEKNTPLAKEISRNFWHAEFKDTEGTPTSAYKKIIQSEQGLNLLKVFFPTLVEKPQKVVSNNPHSLFNSKESTNSPLKDAPTNSPN